MIEQQLEILIKEWQTCRKCVLGERAFKHCVVDVIWNENSVVGNGRIHALFIGEGPGRSEDAIGKPFCGRSGRLLRNAIRIVNEQEYGYAFSNLLACRPTDEVGGYDRSPKPEEVNACSERVIRLIEILKPRVVVTVGRVPQEYLRDVSMQGAERAFILHPSYVIRTGGELSAIYPEWRDSIRHVFQLPEK